MRKYDLLMVLPTQVWQTSCEIYQVAKLAGLCPTNKNHVNVTLRALTKDNQLSVNDNQIPYLYRRAF